MLASCSDVPKCNYVGVSSEGANAGCMVVHNKKILIVEDNSGLLSLPGGSMNPGEIAQCTAEREVWEETGIVVKANNKIETFANGFQLFDCEALGAQIMDGSNRPWRFEVDEVHWVGLVELSKGRWRFPKQVALMRQYLEDK